MARIFISPVIGTGTAKDPRRPKMSGVDANYIIPEGKDWCLCIVYSGNFAALDADTELQGVPEDTSLSLSSISAQARTRLQNFLTSKGVDMTGITNASTFQMVLRRALETLDPDVSPIKLGL